MSDDGSNNGNMTASCVEKICSQECEDNASIDWCEVDKIDAQLGKLSSSAARVELEGLASRIDSEKKKLKVLVGKHTQAVDEMARVRREIATERDRIFEEHSRVESELESTSKKNGEYSSGDCSQLEAELALVKKKMDSKKASHDKYIETHLATLRKRERQVIVQTKTVTNLFHRKLALGQRVFQSHQDSTNGRPSTRNLSKNQEEQVEPEENEERREESSLPKRGVLAKKTKPLSRNGPVPRKRHVRRPQQAA